MICDGDNSLLENIKFMYGNQIVLVKVIKLTFVAGRCHKLLWPEIISFLSQTSHGQQQHVIVTIGQQ